MARFVLDTNTVSQILRRNATATAHLREAARNDDDLFLCPVVFYVRVKWIRDVPREQAYWEKGLFAIQHTACRLRSSFTIERIVKHFGIED